MGQLTDKAIQLSQTYRTCAGALIERTRELKDNGVITQAQYDVVFRRFLQITQQAVSILDEASHVEALGLDRDINSIEAATSQLKNAFDNVKQAQDVVEISLSLLAAVGSVAVVVADPTHVSATAAAGAVATAAKTVAKVAIGS